jgi:signal transduction histidine kinase
MATKTKRYRGRLRWKIFAFMAFVGIVPLVVAAALTYYVVTASHRDDVAKVESAVLAQAGNEVQSYITNSILAHATVEIPYGGNLFATSSIPAQQYALGQALAVAPYLQAEAYVNLAGTVTAAADRTHQQGMDAASFANMSASSAFQAAKQGGSWLGPVTYAGQPLAPMVSFALPVHDENGQTIGVIVGTSTLSGLQTIVGSARIGASGYLYLVDQNGAIIAGGSGAAGANENFSNDIGSTAVDASPVVQATMAGNDANTAATQERYRNLFGTGVVAAGESIPMNGQYWGLVAEWPASEADAVINALLWRDALMLLAVFAVVLGISAILAAIIVRPIRRLEEGTARVAQGKFDMGVAIATGDELEELGNSFNDMVVGLKQLEQLKDEFVFVAAHELRTPVAAMKGYLELILEGQTGAITDGTRTFIEKVIASNKRLVQLVNDLLEVARSQAGRLTIKVSPVDIAPAIASTLDELKSLADEKAVTMEYAGALPDGTALPKALADADRVKEVVVNLVGNAIKYMGGAGRVVITHELAHAGPTPDAPSGTALLVTHIADTGLGMSAEAQQHLFEKFYRVQTDRTRDIQGTGLGLFIVKEIIEKMGGTIAVASEDGKGSTFSFALKVAG